MKTLSAILEQLREDLETDIPSLLVAAELPAFDNFVIGQSRDAKLKSICVYKDELRQDEAQNRLSLIVQVQGFGIGYGDGIKIEDILFEYIWEYEPSNFEMDLTESVTSDTWPIDRNSGVNIFITAVFTQEVDSCD